MSNARTLASSAPLESIQKIFGSKEMPKSLWDVFCFGPHQERKQPVHAAFTNQKSLLFPLTDRPKQKVSV